MAVPTFIGTPTLVEGTGSSRNASHTINTSAEVTIITVVAYLAAGSIARPTVTVADNTVNFGTERFGQFAIANDQYAGHFYVSSPATGAKTVTVTFTNATAMACAAFDYDDLNAPSTPFSAHTNAEGTSNNPNSSITAGTDSHVISTYGWYNLTRSSINDGGTNISYDANGASYVSRSTHYTAGNGGSTSSSLTLSGSGEWLGVLSVLEGVASGGGDPEGSLLGGGKLTRGLLLRGGVLIGR